jgi:hypothetical protein
VAFSGLAARLLVVLAARLSELAAKILVIATVVDNSETFQCIIRTGHTA